MQTYQQWLKENHPEILEEGFADWGRKLALGAALGAGAMGLYNNMGNSPTPNQPAIQQSKSDFWTTGVGHDKNDPNIIVASELGMNKEKTAMKAKAKLAQFLGTKILHGVTVSYEHDGNTWKATVKWSKANANAAKQVAQEMM